MKNLQSLLNTSTIFGFAAAITVAGASIENPYLINTGINLGVSGGVATLVSKKSQRQQQQHQILTVVSRLSNHILNLVTNIEQIDNNFLQQQQEFQALQSQHQQTIQEQKQLSFEVGNAKRQLNNHSKKLKKQQHEINTQKTNQNKVTSDLQKLNNKQHESSTAYFQHLSKIEVQVDKIIEINQNNSTQFVTTYKTTHQKKVTAPTVSRQLQTLCYIDNNNFFNCLKEMGIEADYKALLIYLTAQINKIQIKLYDGAFSKPTPYQQYKYSYLKQLGYQVFTFPIIKREQGKFKTVGDDVQLAIDMVKDIRSGDSVILITGDGDLYPAVKEIKQRNVHVTVIAKNSSVNHNLRDLADEFISLDSIKYNIAKHTKISA